MSTSRTSPGGGEGKEAPSRACDACRRMKIRCTDKENPPCKRCRTMDIPCTFELGSVPRLSTDETEGFMQVAKNRLDQLDGQVDSINNKLDSIASLLAHLIPKTPADTPLQSSGLDNAATLPTTDSARAQISPAPTSTTPEVMTSMSFVQPSLQLPVELALPSYETHHDGSDDDEDEDDPLESAMQWEPFRVMTAREEDARLRAEGQPVDKRGTKRRRCVSEETGGKASKTGMTLEDYPPIRVKGSTSALQDPVTLSYCPEAEGRALFDSFFANAHGFIPILDPVTDTWEDLRRRSPFLITTILWVALRARDGCRRPSHLSAQCKTLAESMASLTLFSPVATLETLQALVLLSSWGEHAWRSCCHAMAMAVDMRLFRCLPDLYARRHQRTTADLERQRPLVAGARLWLALVKQTYEQSYNHALPIQFPCDKGERTAFARELLDHPLSNLYDSRLIVSVEILEARECAFRPYRRITDESADEIDASLRAANKGLQECYAYWRDYYNRIGLSADHFLVKELGSQKAYSILYTNSPAWYGVRSRADVANLSAERRAWVASAARNGAYIVAELGSGKQERGSEFANHNFHVAIVATARYLIRMVELLPDVCDLYQVSYDIDKLLFKLPDYPAHAFTPILARSLAKARDRGVLPTTSISEAAALAAAFSTQQHAREEPAAVNPAFDQSPSLTVDSGLDLDLDASLLDCFPWGAETTSWLHPSFDDAANLFAAPSVLAQ